MINDNKYNKLEYLKADLSQHTRNPMLFRVEQYTQYKNTVICEDWSGMNRRRIDFSCCNFDGCNLERTGFAGSNFINCTFDNCNVKNTNFSQCSFYNCKFNCNIESTDFNGSKFSNVIFNGELISDTIFTNAYMYNVEFYKCQMISLNWEFCDFVSATFIECFFSMLNFEFAIFKDIHFINTLIPFQSIPFVFGGPQYVLSTDDNVYFKSESKGKINISEYRECMRKMLEFYKMTNNVFPTANLLLAYGKADEGYEIIKDGIVQITELKKYRTLKYLTYLFNATTAISNKKKPHLYTELFETLKKVSVSTEIDDFDRRMYFNQIRDTLLPTNNGGCIYTFKTNIDSTETERIKALYNVLDKIADCFDGCSHRIHISHNSEVVMELLLIGMPAVISATAQIISAIITKKNKNKSVLSNDLSVTININTNTLNISSDKLQNIKDAVIKLDNLDINLETLCTMYHCQNPNSDTSEPHQNE